MFSVAVGYIKHPAMTCIARELLRFPHLSRHEPVAWMLTPGSRDLHVRSGRVGPVCRTCVCMERERVSKIQGRLPMWGGQVSSLPCGVTCAQGFHPFQHLLVTHAPHQRGHRGSQAAACLAWARFGLLVQSTAAFISPRQEEWLH